MIYFHFYNFFKCLPWLHITGTHPPTDLTLPESIRKAVVRTSHAVKNLKKKRPEGASTVRSVVLKSRCWMQTECPICPYVSLAERWTYRVQHRQLLFDCEPAPLGLAEPALLLPYLPLFLSCPFLFTHPTPTLPHLHQTYSNPPQQSAIFYPEKENATHFCIIVRASTFLWSTRPIHSWRGKHLSSGPWQCSLLTCLFCFVFYFCPYVQTNPPYLIFESKCCLSVCFAIGTLYERKKCKKSNWLGNWTFPGPLTSLTCWAFCFCLFLMSQRTLMPLPLTGWRLFYPCSCVWKVHPSFRLGRRL